ncbi:expressed unknown protein [Seminavis robusta]|uniref:SAP domain-containing protein n=1 Tax=Seminavis robusta TaxID=568900 RepID=A0A9N8DB69_9STRA|nr:expressed unknown protein [Seminavis robusta]|eukprot:Sro42_g025630.1 n/a (796) ;mRNA; r:76061-78448
MLVVPVDGFHSLPLATVKLRDPSFTSSCRSLSRCLSLLQRSNFNAKRQQQCYGSLRNLVCLQGVESDAAADADDDEEDGEIRGKTDESLLRQVELQQQQINQLLSMMTTQQEQKSKPEEDEEPPPKQVEEPMPQTDPSPAQNSPPRTSFSQHGMPPQPLQPPPPPQRHQAPVAPAVATTAMSPLKAMLFVDGTWLYYSIHERQDYLCPIIKKYGRGWQRKYYFDWSALPRVICQALYEHDDGWAVQSRPVEIARVSVFTSYKAHTNPNSYRFQMYQDMSKANFDVHMMETVGKSEKCVDINIAVEMLHYATVPNAYDVALLLTGDKDFIPAMIRTRQKGRKVGLVSMRSGCNKALSEIPTDSNNHNEHNHNIRDYDVVWIEDYLDELIKPRTDVKIPVDWGALTPFTAMKVISDFISQSGDLMTRGVSSRDLGRYLKRLEIGHGSNKRTLLDEIKISYGGLHQYFFASGCFSTHALNDQEMDLAGQSDRSYWVRLRSDADMTLMRAAKADELSDIEKEFFDSYSLEPLEDKKESYFHSLLLQRKLQSSENKNPNFNPYEPDFKPDVNHHFQATNGDANNHQQEAQEEELELPEELTQDFSTLTVAKLKDFCRGNGLKVSGTKAELLERIQEFVDVRVEELEKEHEEKLLQQQQSRQVVMDNPQDPMNGSEPVAQDGDIGYLEALVIEFAKASGGKANSRELGRYLSANRASPKRMQLSNNQIRVSALQELKENHGSIKGFVANKPSLFEMKPIDRSEFSDPDDPHNRYTFYVALREPPLTSSVSARPQATEQRAY